MFMQDSITFKVIRNFKRAVPINASLEICSIYKCVGVTYWTKSLLKSLVKTGFIRTRWESTKKHFPAVVSIFLLSQNLSGEYPKRLM